MKLKVTLLTLLFAFSLTAQAEISLTESDVLGTWDITAESNKVSGGNVRKVFNTTWTFNKDGTLIGESEDNEPHARIEKMRAVLKYSIENGTIIKQRAPGRSKMETCTAVEKEGAKMVLKCSFNYFFMTKK